MPSALCTICIPAFQAALFIPRTLDCAQAQTEHAIAIHVSVDQSDDATADICEARAKTDPRIKVWRQSKRVGWIENTNFLISRVETPYYFFYFHDDVIVDNYVGRLCALLRDRPDAASAHGDMQHFGFSDNVAPGAPFEGVFFDRLFQFLDGKNQPPLLRSVTRTDAARRMGLTVPVSRGGGIGAHHVYVLGLLACGRALHAPEPLYLRHNRRSGGLTESWRHLPMEQVRDAFHDNAEAVMQLRVDDGAQARELQRLVAYLFIMTWLRKAELERGITDPAPPSAISPHFTNFLPLHALASAEPWVQKRVLRGYARLLYFEAEQCVRRRDFDGGLSKFSASVIADAGEGPAVNRLSKARRMASSQPRLFELASGPGVAALTASDRVQLLLSAGVVS